jgi:hypothetical protein
VLLRVAAFLLGFSVVPLTTSAVIAQSTATPAERALSGVVHDPSGAIRTQQSKHMPDVGTAIPFSLVNLISS